MNAPEVLEKKDLVTYDTDNHTSALMLDPTNMKSMMEAATFMASAKSTLPTAYRNSPGDCLAVVMQAIQWGMNPFAVAQKTHFINGSIGYEAQLVNAVIISRAPVKDRLNFEWNGPWEKIVGKFKEVESKTKKDDHGHPVKYRVPAWALTDEVDLSVRVWATFKGESTPRELTLLMTQARTRNSTLWADDPKQQLAYLAIKRWSRLYCPDVIMGVYTPDELEDGFIEKEVTGEVISGAGSSETKKPKQGQAAVRPAYPEAKFNENFATWQEAIGSGRNTPEGVIHKVEKLFEMSEGQKEKIREIQRKPDTQATPAESPKATPPVIDQIKLKAEAATISEAEICKHLGIESMDAMTVSQAEAAIAFIANPTGA